MRALHALYERTHHLVFTLSMRITKSRDAAEEVTLDVFNDVWQRAATYDPAAGSVVAWIMMRTRSIALNRLSLDDTKKPVSHNGDSSLPPTAATDTDEAVSLRIQGHLLRDALTVLPPAEREALKAAFFSESSYDDIAARVDQPSQTIASRIQSGLEKLRQALARTMGAR